MDLPSRLFDRRALALHASRARRAKRPGADFLLAHVRDDLLLRLATVQRVFPLALDLFSPDGRAAGAIAAPGRTVFRAEAGCDAPNTVGIAHPPPCGEGRAEGAGRVSGRYDMHGCASPPQPSPTRGEGVPLRFDEVGDDPEGNLIADPDALPFGDASLDLAVSLLALHWCDDLPGLLAQVRRALRPDGLFLACLAGGRTLHELRSVLAQAESEVEGGTSPRVIPFVDLRDAGALLQRAGFALPVTDVDTLTVRYDSLFALATDLRAMGAANPLRERSKRFTRRTTFLRAAELYAQRFADPDGRIRATFDLVWLSGWAPHESQQKPLAPGSAKRSLAEALGAREVKLRGDEP